jgi:DNA-directed RNA polymerase subunit RPC12/RpoP
MPRSRIPKPCIERLSDGRGCPEYAIPGRSRREAHRREALAKRDLSPGTTPAWRKARKIALERTGYRCERCGKTDAESRAEGKGGLHVHHVDGRGVRAQEHDQALLEVRCPPCHRLTLRRASVKRARAERR